MILIKKRDQSTFLDDYRMSPAAIQRRKDNGSITRTTIDKQYLIIRNKFLLELYAGGKINMPMKSKIFIYAFLKMRMLNLYSIVIDKPDQANECGRTGIPTRLSGQINQQSALRKYFVEGMFL